ncbi:hypothetical protein BGX33_001948 [Mortierella sp. NVP41]|nr:hypothetical protein BGX33_001948 [Mortierella sp. NVP41]
MNFPSLLSDHEQRAFSEFLNQLAQEDNTGQLKVDGLNGPSGVDPTLTQQQQQQLQLQLQHHLHLRQLQQQHQQQQQQNGHPGLPRMQGPPSLLPPPMALDPAQALQAAQAQQQRDWIQQISANPLLAPGGVINPHAMSQAMLQNPLLMAQANAISQAMVLAQQQQQLQLQLQQQQQQHFQQQHLQQQQQHDNHGHSLHHSMQQQQQHQHPHPFQQQSHSMAPPPPHSQQQQPYPGQQHHQQQQYQPHHPNHEPMSPSSESGAPQQKSSKPAAKWKSKSEVPPSESSGQENGGSASPQPSSPLPPSTPIRGQHSPAETMGMNGNSAQNSKQESDNENTPAPLTKKAARRKGSMAKSMSMDSSSGLVAKSPHRSSRDGFDPLQGTPRKKGKSDSISKLGLSPSQQNNIINGNANDRNQFKEESVEAESKQEGASPSPSIKQKHNSMSPAPSQPPSSTPAPAKSGTKKPPHELLTEAEKKANHIASEQKRRQNIRVGFDSLVEIVPTLSDCHRSEAVILQKSVDYIHRLLSQKNELKSRVRELQTHLGDPLDDVDSGSDMEVEQYE